jgi:hypothetical protein
MSGATDTRKVAANGALSDDQRHELAGQWRSAARQQADDAEQLRTRALLLQTDPELAEELCGEVARITQRSAGLAVVSGRPPEPDRSHPGGSCILDAPQDIPTVWGRGEQIAWAEGEPLLMVAPPGLGKTTLLQQLAIGRVGLEDFCDLLGYPIGVGGDQVLYVAADRPTQAIRSFRRMVIEEHRELLDSWLRIWKGPLPFDLATEPQRFVPFCERYEARTVLIDSLGAVAFDLASDEAGARVASAFNEATAAGIQLAVTHHDRKREQGPGRVRGLDDVYGSRWITACAGSVLYLDGKPGDLIVKARHLKQPAEEVGPLTIRHDHEAGRTELHQTPDLLDLAANGVNVKDAAKQIFETAEPTANEIEKARYRLGKLVDSGKLRPEVAKGEPIVYWTVPA